MLFSSITFIFYFLPIVLLLYKIVPTAYKNSFLLLSSLIFYTYGEPGYLFLLLLSIAISYFLAFHLYQNKLLLFTGITFHVGLLFFFKYIPHMLPHFSAIALPLGISFYTFQIMSYLWDVYHGKVEAQRSFIDYACYVTLFPQLIAGPIVRYTTIVDELHAVRTPDYENGLTYFIIGLSEKVLLANNAGRIWEETKQRLLFSLDSGSSLLSMSTAWISLLFYAFQIYFDFDGYSNMAIGLSQLFGFHFPDNFHKPYISKSISEFWTRWHISLSSWFKEYIYIPLGGNRKGFLIQLRNIFIVWILTGIWHGASLNFLVWGFYFGFLLVLEKLFLKRMLAVIPAFFQHLYTIFLLLIGWTIFAFESWRELSFYLKSLFQTTLFYDSHTIPILRNNCILFILCILFSTDYIHIHNKRLRQILLVLCFCVSIAYIVSDTYNPFLYFRF